MILEALVLGIGRSPQDDDRVHVELVRDVGIAWHVARKTNVRCRSDGTASGSLRSERCQFVDHGRC